jgi:integrase
MGRKIGGLYSRNGRFIAGYREPGTASWRTTTLKATTPKAAKHERDALLAALREGRQAARSDSTLAALCDEWLATRSAAATAGRLAARTYEYDCTQVKRIKPVLGHLRVQALTVTDVRRLLDRTSTLAEWTRYGLLRTLKAVLKTARDEGLILRDPTEVLQRHERPKQHSRRKGQRLSPEQLGAVIATAEKKAPSYAVVIVLLAFTGMRIREALAVRWQDVDVDSATLRVHCQLAIDDRTIVPKPKTDASLRELPILPALRRRLIAHRLASPWTRPGDFVSATPSGTPKGYRNVRRALAIIGEELGIDLASHDFRRSLASFLIIAARADEAAVTGLMGHANIETTGASMPPTGGRRRSVTRSSCASSPRPGLASRRQTTPGNRRSKRLSTGL